MWIERLASVLQNLVFISNKGSLNFTRPKSFDHVRDIHSVTDASELFIETPKAPFLQKLTCSEYKYHKTAKMSITINRAIIYICNSKSNNTFSVKSISRFNFR